MIRVEPLETNIDILRHFYTDMQLAWTERGGEPVIRELMAKQEDQLQRGKAKGILLFNDATPLGWASVERMTPNYGNMMLFCADSSSQKQLVAALTESGLTDNLLAELFTFEEIGEYPQYFRDAGYDDNYRQRMAYSLEQTPYDTYPEWPIGMAIVPIETSMLEGLCQVYAAAHQVSKDYVGFYELEQYDRRLKLEKDAMSGVYGQYVQASSLALMHRGDIIGGCSIVEVETWGMPKVPWIFDVCIRPDMHGKGYGKKLMQHMMATLNELEYPAIGLAVTMNNESAIALYEKLGFFTVDPFHEFAYKVL